MSDTYNDMEMCEQLLQSVIVHAGKSVLTKHFDTE